MKPRADCIIDSDGERCRSYAPSHNMHFIHAKQLGLSPWGWRDGVIASVKPNGWIEVDYVTEPGRAVAYHHGDLTGVLAPGDPVRVHEKLHALGASFGWINLWVASGIGPAPEPDNPELWAAQMSWGVVNLATGRALAMDHEHLTDEVE